MSKLYFLSFVTLLTLVFSNVYAQNFESSNLPIVVINTEGQTIVDEPKVNVRMGIIDNGPGNRNYYRNPFNNNQPDPFNNYDGTIGIEFRGSSSQSFNKKPYGFETRELNSTTSKKVSLLGMPAESDWILNATYNDKSLIRDVLTYHLSNQMGMYASRTKYVELVMDGVYQGIYILMERIKRDASRVDVASLKTTDNSGDALTGGYILKIDKSTGTPNGQWKSPYPAANNMGLYVLVDYPKLTNLTSTQLSYIQNHVTNFEHSLQSPDFKDPNNGYAKYIDVNTFVDYLLLTEITHNPDAYALSTFFYKDRDSRNAKIKMGPPWDYNHAYGNANYCQGWETNTWTFLTTKLYCQDAGSQVPFWWERLLEDRDFCIKVRDRWKQLRQNQWTNNNINQFVDQNASLLNEAQTRNFQRWPILGEWTWPNYYYGNTYQEEVDWLKNWTKDRLIWLDANIPRIGVLNQEVIDCASIAKPGVVSPVSYCQGQTSIPLTANGVNLKWYTFATDGQGSSTAPTPSTQSIGTTSYFVSQTIGECESGRTQIDVTVGTKPAAPSANNVEYCQGQTASALTANGTNLKWYTSSSGGESSTTAPIPPTNSPNLLSYFVAQSTNGCESDRTQINVSVRIRPSKPQVTISQSYCQGQAANELSASGSNLKWYDTAVNGTGTTTAPTPSTASAGTISYYVSQTANNCESDRAQINVTVSSKPSPPAISNVEYCEGQNPTQLTANGSALKWYSTADGIESNATAPTPATSSVGSVSYFVSQTVNGCESNRTQITVNIKARPGQPQATSALSFCVGQSTTPLSASGTNLKWYTSATSTVGNTASPTPSTGSVGTTSYFVSQTISGCESNRSQVTVTVNSKPAPPAASNVTYCQQERANPLTANGSELKWYTAPNEGIGSIMAPVPSTTANTVLSYFVSQTVNGCESNRTQINVSIKVKPSPPQTTANVSYCQGQAASLLSASGTSLKWYDTPTDGISSTSTPTPSTATSGTFFHFVTQTINGCESDRTQINVRIKTSPEPPTAINTEYCQGQAASQLTATGTELKWYNAQSGGGSTSIAPTPSTSSSGNFNYFVSQTVNGCESSRTQLIINIKAKPAKPQVVSGTSYCQGQTPAQLSAVGSNLKWYTTATGGTANLTAPTPTSTTAGTVSHFVSQSINNCESDRAQVSVVIFAKPDKPSTSAVVKYTQGQTASPLIATGVNLKWYTTANGGTSSSTSPLPSTSSVGTTTYFVSQTINNCESDRAQTEVQVSLPSTTTTCISTKVFLEGALSGTTMSTRLSQLGLLPGQSPANALAVTTPAGQPYKTAPWNYNGEESLDGYTNDIVDWVLVSLRISPQDPSTTIYKTAAILRKDGVVSMVSGCPTLKTGQAVYVTVEHRNHIGAVSHEAVSALNGKISYDFTKNQSYIPPSAPASGQLQVGSVFCLIAADGSKASFSEINANDASVWQSDNGKFGVYRLSDFNLDGEINANDGSIWRRNNGKFSGVRF